MSAAPLVRPWPAAGDLDRLRRGALDVHAVVDRVCDRIDEVDDRVHAFLDEPDRRARLHRDAAALVERWPEPARRPLLFGAPVAIKDVVHVDGFPTRAGSEVPESVLQGRQAVAIDRLVDAGALIAGKTVTAEFACVAPGPTRNPNHLEHTPGGSSSGSAAAVAAGMVPLAVGTQTIGSIIRPASFCGIVGFKPSHGRIPIVGVIPHSPTFDTVGLFAADVASVVSVAAAVCDDWRPVDGERPVLGVVEGSYMEQHEQDAARACARALLKLRQAGYEVRPAPVLDDHDEIRIHNFVVNRYELARTHERWVRDHRDRYRAETLAAIDEGSAVSEAAYEESRAACEWFRGDLPTRMAAAGVEVVIAPSTLAGAPQGLARTGDASMNLPWTYAGAPAITLPIGADARGLPLGLQCVGRLGADERLLAGAHGIEGALAAPLG